VKRYGRNIGLNYLYVSLGSMNLTHGLWMIYLASRGFNLVQLGILEGIYHITSFLMEVPTGVVADLWGRKVSRIAGRIVSVASLAIMFYARSFPLQAIAFVATALGNNLESGAGDALVYDSLLLDGREHKYMKVAGKQELVYQATLIVSFALGGYLALRSYAAVFGLSMGFFTAAAVCAFLFREPHIERNEAFGRHGGLLGKIGNSMRMQLVESLAIMRKRGRIAFFIVFSELLFCLITVQFFYLQNHWIALGWTEFDIGLVFAANAVVAGITAVKAAKIEQRIGERGVLTFMPLLMLFCLWGVATTPFGQVFFILVGCVEGILITAVGTYINRLIPSAQRATILSFQSMAFSLFMIVVFPAVGAIGEAWSIPTAFVVMAVAASLLCIPYLLVVKPYSIKE